MVTKIVKPGSVSGELKVPPSKSYAQRYVAAAVCSELPTRLLNYPECDDAVIALGIAEALGCRVVTTEDTEVVIKPDEKELNKEFDCGDSGLALRMFIPIAARFCSEITVTAGKQLSSRPISFVQSPLKQLGVSCNDRPPLSLCGFLKSGKIYFDSPITSQFISGLLLGLPTVKGNSLISVKNPTSKPYLEMTLETIHDFGGKVSASAELTEFEIEGGQIYNGGEHAIEGDWSAASFLVVAAAISGKLKLTDLSNNSIQADTAIIDILKEAGALVVEAENAVSIESSSLKNFEFDLTDCPDLAPALAALACYCDGTSRLRGISRLKYKESNRINAICSELTKLGIRVTNTNDCIEIKGGKPAGGTVSSWQDHRIAMMAAVVGLQAAESVRIEQAEAVAKSYPGFFTDLDGIRSDK